MFSFKKTVAVKCTRGNVRHTVKVLNYFLYLRQNVYVYSMNDHPLELTIRIDWSEMDLFGHVNNVSYFKYVQAARVNYWEHIGLTRLHTKENIGAMLASSSCQFKQPLFYPGNVLIRSRVEFMKTTSFGLRHQLINEKNELCAEAQDVMVLFNFNDHTKVLIPDTIREKIEETESRTF
jgi:acyl-CoA thioester hydrolase